MNATCMKGPTTFIDTNTFFTCVGKMVAWPCSQVRATVTFLLRKVAMINIVQ